MFKKVMILSLLALNTCYAGSLTSYQDTVNSLNNGKSIKFVIDWDQCKINIPNVKPNFSSSYSPDNVNISKQGYIQASGVSYAHEIGMIPNLVSVNQAFVYTFAKNNELHVTNRFLDPVTYAEKFPAIEATCQLGVGFKVFD